MKSMDTILAESVGQMDVFQKDAFWKKRKSGMPIEAQVSLAKEVLLTESRRITRNNGGGRQLTEAETRESAMQECDRILFSGMEAARSTAKGISELVEVSGEYRRRAEGADQLTESQRADLEFCRQLGMSESDAMKVATSKGGVRGN